MTLTAKDVAEITRLLADSTFDELALELDGLKLTVRRGGIGPPGTPRPPEGAAPSPPAAPASSGRPGIAGAPSRSASASDGTTLDIAAPLLGTFYRAPKPGAAPFVEVGSAVEEGTIIGIIEVMKLMNTVRAGARGEISEILAGDGALVESGETLMRVIKAARA